MEYGATQFWEYLTECDDLKAELVPELLRLFGVHHTSTVPSEQSSTSTFLLWGLPPTHSMLSPCDKCEKWPVWSYTFILYL